MLYFFRNRITSLIQFDGSLRPDTGARWENAIAPQIYQNAF